jgi:hypothetical protein
MRRPPDPTVFSEPFGSSTFKNLGTARKLLQHKVVPELDGETARHKNADRGYLEEGVQLLELAQNAQRLFAKQEPGEKRRLLNFLLSNCTWEDGEVVASFRQPFDMLAETMASPLRSEAVNGTKITEHEKWLRGLDSNQRPVD